MNLTVDELIDKAKDQYNRQRYEESLVSAEIAIQTDKENVNGWWFAALSQIALENHDKALESLEVVIGLAPYFTDGVVRYGATLQAVGSDKEAQEIFEMAIEEDDSHVGALSALAGIYQENDNDDQNEIDKEISVLTRLDESEGWLTSKQLNRFGILYYKNKSFSSISMYQLHQHLVRLLNDYTQVQD